MIRLLSIQPVAERGGSDHALLRMLRSLPPDEFECHVVVPADPPLRDELESAGVTVHVIPMRRISTSHGIGAWFGYAAGWPLAVGRIARLVRRVDVNVVHTNSLHSWYGWAAAGLTRRPHVWHAREIVVQSGAALRVERFLTKHATRVIAMSNAIADQLDRRNVVVVYETADPAEFHPSRAGRFRARVGIPDDAPLAGTAGRIDTWKGIDVLLGAWAHVKEARPDAHLVVAGGPVRDKERYFDDLASVAGALADAHWLGMRDDIPDLFADLDVFVLAVDRARAVRAGRGRGARERHAGRRDRRRWAAGDPRWVAPGRRATRPARRRGRARRRDRRRARRRPSDQRRQSRPPTPRARARPVLGGVPIRFRRTARAGNPAPSRPVTDSPAGDGRGTFR